MSTTTKKGIFRLLEIAGAKKYYLFFSAVFALLHAALSLIPYILVYYILQELITNSLNSPQIKIYLIAAIITGLLSYLAYYLSGLLAHIGAFKILYELRKITAAKLGKIPLGFIQNFRSGALKKIVSDDIERIEGFIAHQIPDFTKAVLLPLITIIYLLYVDYRLALVSLAPFLILAIWIPAIFSSKYTKKMMQQHHQSQEEMNSTIVEFVRAMPVMKIFAQTADKFKKYSNSVNGFAKFSIQWLYQSGPPFAIFMSFISNASLPVLILGTYLFLQNGLTVSVLILFLILGVGYIKPVFALANMGMQIILINKGVERMDSILQYPVIEVDDPQNINDYNIHFKKVTFAYDEGVNVLKGVSFRLPENKITAFIGPSGAGKSTAAQLIARFWEITEGEISIGGTDIKNISNEKLMQTVSFVFQDSFMFRETIYENIRMGMDKTKEEIIKAAKAARCHHFISQLPRGYQTLYGGKGVYLSGGEQQRIQLARAILKDTPILILDEATAFSDPENEAEIQKAVSQLIKNKTVIIIAHRLSTIIDVDQIILFNKGSVVNTGTHQELLESTKLYQKMWNAHIGAQSFSI